jgi:hypothetical protein
MKPFPSQAQSSPFLMKSLSLHLNLSRSGILIFTPSSSLVLMKPGMIVIHMPQADSLVNLSH